MDAAISTGQSVADNTVGRLTGTGLAPFIVRVFGGASQEARQGGADLRQQLVYSTAQAAKEYIGEKLFGIAVPQRISGSGGFGSVDEGIEKMIRYVTDSLAGTPGGKKALGGLLTWGAGGATEALEGGFGALVENLIINPCLRGWDPDTRTGREKLDDAIRDMYLEGLGGLLGVTSLLGYQEGGNATGTPRGQAETAAGAEMRAPEVMDAFLEGFLDGNTEPVQAGRGTAAKGSYSGEALALPQGGVVTGLADSGGGRLALEGHGGLPGVVDSQELYAAALQNGFVQPGAMRDWRAEVPALYWEFLQNLHGIQGARPAVPLLPEWSVLGMGAAQGVQEIGADRPLNILEQTIQQPYGPEGSVVPETDHTLLQALLNDEALRGDVSKTWAELLQDRENCAILKRKIGSGEISTKISFQQQRKHIDGTPQFKQYLSSRIAKGGTPQSILTLSQEGAQDIIDRFSGTGVVKIIKTGEHSVKITEYVTTDRVVGLFFENNQFKETRRVCILYGKNGAHVVPTKEDYHG